MRYGRNTADAETGADGGEGREVSLVFVRKPRHPSKDSGSVPGALPPPAPRAAKAFREPARASRNQSPLESLGRESPGCPLRVAENTARRKAVGMTDAAHAALGPVGR